MSMGCSSSFIVMDTKWFTKHRNPRIVRETRLHPNLLTDWQDALVGISPRTTQPIPTSHRRSERPFFLSRVCSEFRPTHRCTCPAVIINVCMNITNLCDCNIVCVGSAASSSVRRSMCIRIYYLRRDTGAGPGGCEHVTDGYFHTFCSTGTRLFNNIVITLRSEDEARGYYSSVLGVIVYGFVKLVWIFRCLFGNNLVF